MWRRYYARWRVATREILPAELLELMPPLAALCPPATIIDKNFAIPPSPIPGSFTPRQSECPPRGVVGGYKDRR